MTINIAGYEVVIDDEDFKTVSGIAWTVTPKSSRGGPYVIKHKMVNGKKRIVFLHRFLLNEPGGKEVDHKNGDTLDNRKANLRIASHSNNQWNRWRNKNNKTGFKGAHYCIRDKKYRARIFKDGKCVSLGNYNTPEEAYDAYCEASVKLHGEFGRVI